MYEVLDAHINIKTLSLPLGKVAGLGPAVLKNNFLKKPGNISLEF